MRVGAMRAPGTRGRMRLQTAERGTRGGRRRELALDGGIGVLCALGQPPFGLWPVALAGFALALWRMAGVGAGAGDGRAAFRRGLAIGFGHFVLALSWIVQPFLVDPWTYGWLAPGALLAVALGMALFWGVAAVFAHWLNGGAMTLALALSLAELLRGHVLTGFPWALPGHIWADTALAQAASAVGASGLTAVTLIALAAPLSFGWRGGMGSLVMLALAGGWSAHRLMLPEPPARPGMVRIVQPNITQSLKWDPEEAARNFTLLMGMSRDSGADLVLWPETAVPYVVEEGGSAARAIADAGGRAEIATGMQRNHGAKAWNSLGIIGPGGTIRESFDKIHLVPFGEYVPFGDLVHEVTGLSAFAARMGAGYSAGRTRNLLDFHSLGRALPVICYEAIFPDELMTTERPDWILQVTNDGWFGTLTGPYQHFAQVRLRAIEFGLPVLRAANTGISAIIDARGRIARDAGGAPLVLALGRRGVIDGRIPGALALPPYGRVGDLPLFVLLGGVLGGLLLRARVFARGPRHGGS